MADTAQVPQETGLRGQTSYIHLQWLILTIQIFFLLLMFVLVIHLGDKFAHAMA